MTFSHADEIKKVNVKDLGVKVPTDETLSVTDLDIGKKVIGRCDGKNFYEQAAYEGCLKYYDEAHPNITIHPQSVNDISKANPK